MFYFSIVYDMTGINQTDVFQLSTTHFKRNECYTTYICTYIIYIYIYVYLCVCIYICICSEYISMHSLNQFPKMRNLETLLFDGGKETEHKKILMSDVVVTRKRNLFHGRKWNILDIITVLWILAAHLLTLFAPFTFSWGAFWAGFWCYALCGMLGLTLSYHRNLAHRSFKLPKWLEYTFAYFGVQAAQVFSYSFVFLIFAWLKAYI